MQSTNPPFNLLFLASREDQAESIVKTLRNGGLAVHGVRAEDLQQVEDLLMAHPFALILCCEFDPAIDLDTCMSLYRELEVDIPLVVIANRETDSTVLIGAMRAGARDLVEAGDNEHLQLVVARELEDFQTRGVASRLRERLHECEQRARDTIDASGEAVAFVQDGMHVEANPAYRALFRFASEEEVDGYPLLDLVAPGDRQAIRAVLRALQGLAEGEVKSIDLECVRSDTSRFDARIDLAKSRIEGEPCLRIMVAQAAAPTAEASPGLADAETGLPNRSAFLRELTARLTRTGPDARPLAVFYVGVDLFPRLTQDVGLTHGLEAIAAFGALLRELVPAQVYLARLCDDAFGLLMDDLDESDAAALTARIENETYLPLDLSAVVPGERICATGVVLTEPGLAPAAEVLDACYRDYLLDSARTQQGPLANESLPPMPESGYHSELSDEDRWLAALITDALAGDGFELVYQPIVSLKGDSQENYSVFLRLRDDDMRLREAKEFLAAAVRSGRMAAVDRWVIQHAIEVLVRHRAEDRRLNFFVNVAEESLQDEGFLVWICDNLEEFKARGNWLTFQVLEDDARRHAAEFARLSDGLRMVKCRVAINRFGLGPSPEVLLQGGSADFVKLAPELGAGLADDEGKQKRLRALTAAVREAGVRSVFTGVEDARTLTVLWQAGVDYVQGNFLQKPLPTIENE
jgi:EAL domain-containing protein (putative c-di-GMP-specific phosphodiesterase class I)/PleD family two-component response regulator